jgi:two-component system nitrogen regulation sensor histidine kinase NtrY
VARLEPERSQEYRRRFDAVRALHNRLEIVRSGQQEMIRNQERVVFVLVALTLIAIAATTLFRRRREVARLDRIEKFVERLSSGETHLRVGERGTDAIAKIAGMIERTSDVIGAERQRLRHLENLSAWQEAARRHAHEIRTPLTAAQLELDRLGTEIARSHPDAQQIVDERRSQIAEELERLRVFTREFTSFAAIGAPQLHRADLDALLREFASTFATAWPLSLSVEGEGCEVRVDRGMLRQVLVNLCTNSARASASAVRFRLACDRALARIEISDDGKGVPEPVRGRLFQPYVTTRRVGEGMGLGLSISKKIMLDQGGDLTLGSTSERGTTFVLTIPREGTRS